MRALKIIGAISGVLLALFAGVFVQMRKSQADWEVEGLRRWPMRGEHVERPGGRKLRVWCEGQGTRVILEASGLGGADQYERMLELLRSKARVCAYDRAGFGYSDPRAEETTIAALADDLWAVAQHAGGTDPVVLVGASYGGLVAQYAARAHGPEVRGLVLLDAVSPGAFADLEGPWKKLDGSLNQAATLAKVGLLRKADPFHLGDSRAAWITYRPSTWESVKVLLASRHTAIDAFAQLPPQRADLPVRVFTHTRVGDLLGPAVSLEEHQALEPKWQALQAQLGKPIALPNVGHLIASERPELVAAEIEALLEP